MKTAMQRPKSSHMNQATRQPQITEYINIQNNESIIANANSRIRPRVKSAAKSGGQGLLSTYERLTKLRQNLYPKLYEQIYQQDVQQSQVIGIAQMLNIEQMPCSQGSHQELLSQKISQITNANQMMVIQQNSLVNQSSRGVRKASNDQSSQQSAGSVKPLNAATKNYTIVNKSALKGQSSQNLQIKYSTQTHTRQPSNTLKSMLLLDPSVESASINNEQNTFSVKRLQEGSSQQIETYDTGKNQSETMNTASFEVNAQIVRDNFASPIKGVSHGAIYQPVQRPLTSQLQKMFTPSPMKSKSNLISPNKRAGGGTPFGQFKMQSPTLMQGFNISLGKNRPSMNSQVATSRPKSSIVSSKKQNQFRRPMSIISATNSHHQKAGSALGMATSQTNLSNYRESCTPSQKYYTKTAQNVTTTSPSKIRACKGRFSKLMDTLSKTNKKSVLLDKEELSLLSVGQRAKLKEREAQEKQRNKNNPQKTHLTKLVKDFFNFDEEETKQMQEQLKNQIQTQQRQAEINALRSDNSPNYLSIKSSLKQSKINQSILPNLQGRKGSMRVTNFSKFTRLLGQNTNGNVGNLGSASSGVTHGQANNSTLTKLTSTVNQVKQLQKRGSLCETTTKSGDPLLIGGNSDIGGGKQMRKAVSITQQEQQRLGLQQPRSPNNANRGKKIIQQYKNSKLSGQQQVFNWLLTKLPEYTRKNVEVLYRQKFRQNDEEVYGDSIKRKKMVGNSPERFYRAITDSSEQIPVIGNVRPQSTLKRRLDDDELGSLIAFKVQRHCRHTSAISGANELNESTLFNFTQVSDHHGESSHLNPHLFSPTGQPSNVTPKRNKPKFLIPATDDHEVFSNSANLSQDEQAQAVVIDPRQKLEEKRNKFHRAGTVMPLHRGATGLYESTKVRTAFQQLLRKHTTRLPNKKEDNIDEQLDREPVFDREQIEELFKARCTDLQIMSKEKQFRKFNLKITEMCYNRRCNLTNMLIGPVAAALIARWITFRHIDITHLILAQNNIGDEGVDRLVNAISMSKSLVCVDISQNSLTPKCAQLIAQILSENESIVDLNLGSSQGANRNRFGKDGGLAIAYGFSINRCLVQYLNLRSTTISNYEVELIADSLENYMYLLSLDLSQNRIEGTRGGQAIAKIIGRHINKKGGVDIESINLSHNKLGDGGFCAINLELLTPGSDLGTLNVAYNNISNIKLGIVLEAVSDKTYAVRKLRLDGNTFKNTTHHRLASLLNNARKLSKISMVGCQLEDEGLVITFEALSSLREVRKIDYSNNSIFSKGIEGICQYIGGAYRKSDLETIKLNSNDITDLGFMKLLEAIQNKPNKIKDLSFVSNDMTDEAAQFLYGWLKKMRAKDVDHSMNLIHCDLSLNKIMHKHLKDIENQLTINRKYNIESKNREIQYEVLKKKHSRKELGRTHRKQIRYIHQQKELDEDYRFAQVKSEEYKAELRDKLKTKSQILEALMAQDDKVQEQEAIAYNAQKKSALKEMMQDHDDRMQFIKTRIFDKQVVNQDLQYQIEDQQEKLKLLEDVPEEQKKPTYAPTMKKALKEQEKKRDLARIEYEKAQKYFDKQISMLPTNK